jgi:hypothetical protein
MAGWHSDHRLRRHLDDPARQTRPNPTEVQHELFEFSREGAHRAGSIENEHLFSAGGFFGGVARALEQRQRKAYRASSAPVQNRLGRL